MDQARRNPKKHDQHRRKMRPFTTVVNPKLQTLRRDRALITADMMMRSSVER